MTREPVPQREVVKVSSFKHNQLTTLGILAVDTNPVNEALRKLIAFANNSDETDALKQNGIPLPAHQTLLFEQEIIEASIDILHHVFGFSEQSYEYLIKEKSNDKQTKEDKGKAS